MSYYFVIVGTKDNPIYEAVLSSSKSGGTQQQVPTSAPSSAAASVFGALAAAASSASSTVTTTTQQPSSSSPTAKSNAVGYGPRTSRHVMQLVAHASLDSIEDAQWTNGFMYAMNVLFWLFSIAIAK
jgi:hypothetical protein